VTDPKTAFKGLIDPIGLWVAPDPDHVLVGCADGTILRVDLAAAEASAVARIPGRISAFDIAPDGKTVYAAGRRLGLWEETLAGGGRRLARRLAGTSVLVNPESGRVLVAEASASGRIVSIVPGDLSLTTIAARDLKAVRALLPDSAAGRLLAATANHGGSIAAARDQELPTTLLDGLGDPVELGSTDRAAGS